ncbi:hypothetical protein AKG98_4371 [Moritella sp. JT01]|uniref:hypothetical protein n=1 Tax=Moritella sp. JT01 TaxID=756698 RepID=UPI000793B587|nr:hypothetical protein [Moritella sp. JT01]KXO11884.1 hypothetical protein AKG98_4371 [Moritella sp. JT01]
MMRIISFILAGILLCGCNQQLPWTNDLQVSEKVNQVEFNLFEPEQAKRVLADFLRNKINKDQYYAVTVNYAIEQSSFVDDMKQLVKDIGLDPRKVNFLVKDEQQKKDFKIEIKTQHVSHQECPSYNIFNEGFRAGCVVEINRWKSMVSPVSNLQ